MRPSVKDLNDLLSACTVKLVSGTSVGTGFFVAPGKVLTCAHVIESSKVALQPYWKGSLLEVEKIATTLGPDGQGPDLALITLKDPPQHACCILGADYPQVEDTLVTLGYTSDYAQGDSASFKCEGGSNHPIDGFLLKTKDGQAYPGMSGAPLVNLENGYVCGVMLTERQRTATGGARAIPTQTVFAQWPEISSWQSNLGLAGKLWSEFEWHEQNATHVIDSVGSPLSFEALFKPPLFSGQKRTQIISDLAAKCRDHPILAVEGLSGSGKTYALSEFAYDNSHRGYNAVYWYGARTNETLDELLIQLGPLCQPSGSTQAKCRALFQRLHQRNAVLVIDDFHLVNHRSYGELIDSAAKLGNPATLILVSRIHVDPDLHWDAIDHLEIGGFTQPELAKYLRKVRKLDVSDDAVAILQRKTDGLPMAAQLFGTLVGQFNKNPLDLLSGEMEHNSRLREWFDELNRRLTSDERSVLSALSVYEAPFNRDVVKYIGGYLKLDNSIQALESLQRRYLVQRNTPYRWNVHHLIASFSSEEITVTAQRELFLRFAEQSLKGLDIGKRRPLSEENVVWAIRAIRFLQRAERFDQSGLLLEKLSGVVKSRGFYNLFIPAAEIQVQHDEGSDSWIDYHLAHCYQITGQTIKALEISRQIISERKGSNQNKQLAALRLHAELLIAIHDDSAALRLIRDAVSEFKPSMTSFTIYSHARSIEAMILTKTGNYKEAMELAQILLADYATKGHVRGVAVAEMRIGLLKVAQKDNGAALDYFDRAVKNFQESGDLRGEAWALTNLSEVLLRLGQTSKGSEAMLKGIKTKSQIDDYSDDYRDLLVRVLELRPPRSCLNAVRRELKRVTESVSLFQRNIF
jgi:tetratricopeptide (TPR) repeat protein